MADGNVVQFPVWKHEYLHSVLSAAYNVSRGGDKDDDVALFALLDDAGRTSRKRNPRRMMGVEESEVRVLNTVYAAALGYRHFKYAVGLSDAFFNGNAKEFQKINALLARMKRLAA